MAICVFPAPPIPYKTTAFRCGRSAVVRCNISWIMLISLVLPVKFPLGGNGNSSGIIYITCGAPVANDRWTFIHKKITPYKDSRRWLLLTPFFILPLNPIPVHFCHCFPQHDLHMPADFLVVLVGCICVFHHIDMVLIDTNVDSVLCPWDTRRVFWNNLI